jgi:hypothetical protein
MNSPILLPASREPQLLATDPAAPVGNRRFSHTLSQIWSAVHEKKRLGVVQTLDEQYWLAYRECEHSLLVLCQELEELRQDRARTALTPEGPAGEP